jgi:hypothetical protein
MASNAKISMTLQYPPEDNASDVQIPKIVNITGFTEKVDSTFVLSIGDGLELNLGSVESAKAIYISTTEEITVHLNSSITGFMLAADGVFLLVGGPSAIESITVDVTVEGTSIRLWAIE